MQLLALATPPHAPRPSLHRHQVHRAAITALAALPGASLALAGTEDGQLVRFDTATGQVLESHPAHTAPVEHLAVHHHTVVTAAADGTSQIWTADMALERAHVLADASFPLRQVAASAAHVVAVGDDGVVRVYDRAQGTLLYELSGHRQPVLSVAIDEQVAVTASVDHELRVWDVTTGAALPDLGDPPADVGDVGTILRVPAGPPVAVQLVHGHRVVVAMGTKVVEWDLSTRVETRRWTGTAWPIERLVADDEHLVVVSATEVRVVRMDQWDRTVFRGGTPSGGATAVALASGRVLVGAADGTVVAHDLAGWIPDEQHLSHASGAIVGPDGTVAATVDHDHGVRLWSVATGTPRALIDLPPGPGTTPLAFSGDGLRIALGQRGSPAVILHHHDGRPAGTLDHQPHGHPVAVQSLLFAWDGVLVGPAGPGPIQWWGLDGTTVRTLFGHTANVRQMALSGHRLISEAQFAPEPGSPAVPHLQVWDLWRQCEMWSRAAIAPGGSRVAPAFGPLVVLADGRLLTGTGRATTEIGIYDLERGWIVHRADLGHPWTQAAQAPDGHIYVVAADPVAEVCELLQLDATLQVVLRRPLPTHPAPTAIGVEADRLVWSEGNTVVFTELHTGTELGRSSIPGEATITSLALSYDGQHIVVGGATGRVHVLRT